MITSEMLIIRLLVVLVLFVFLVRLYKYSKFKMQPCYVCGTKIQRGDDKVEIKMPHERYHFDCWTQLCREKFMGDKQNV